MTGTASAVLFFDRDEKLKTTVYNHINATTSRYGLTGSTGHRDGFDRVAR